MTYEEALSFWYGRIDFEKRSAKPEELKLDRMRALLRLVGDPQKRLRIVHVAGTKGKGSTSAMLEAVLRQAGYSVGLFTSPHLEEVTERIQVNRQNITREELIARLEEIRPAVEALERSISNRAPTFFEVGTALGFLHFLYRRVDFVVLEVGLGGRLDSTNVCSPLVSVITEISFDHMAQLGDTLKEIAREKAGIIKPRRPVVTTATEPEAIAEIEQIASERASPLLKLGRDFQVDPTRELNLRGAHQAINAAGVVATVGLLRKRGIPIPDSAIDAGLSAVHWPARMEVMRERPLVILDCAHNVASISALIATLRHLFPQYPRRRLIFAISNDKQFEPILKMLAPHFDHFYLTRYGNNPRCVPPEQLAKLLHSIEPARPFSVHPTSREAWTAALSQSTPESAIVITGSVFLAGEMMSLTRNS
jgi:dihydrofolate synthase/folylpolyglutamate synthase